MKIITVHGIRSESKWYEKLEETENAKSYNLQFINFNYGYFSFLKFLRKKEREKIINDFCQHYNDLNLSDERPCIVAHSFGTYVIFQAMKRYPQIKFDKIVFCGSILNSKTDWREMRNRGQFNKLKNDHGSLEWFLRYTNLLIDDDCGQAGKIGFTDIAPKHKNDIINEESYVDHFQYFLPIRMNQNWLDFITKDLTKIEYNKDILTNNVIQRVYTNSTATQQEFKINEISFNARIDRRGNYYAKYIKKGINESNHLLDTIYFTTTGDGIHAATEMSFGAYTMDNQQLKHGVSKDFNHHKEFKITLPNPVGYKQAIELKYFFCWYKALRLEGDTDHWTIKGIQNISCFLNFPTELVNPRLYGIKEQKVVDQFSFIKKTERDGTVSYSHSITNLNNYEGLVFYFEGLDERMSSKKNIKEFDFSLKGRKDKYFITKASESDIKKVFKIEVEVESLNAANEEVLALRRFMFNDGFLVAKNKKKGSVVGYVESTIWNEKKLDRFEDISNFPLQYNINGQELYIIFLAVAPNHRKQGIAKHLLSEVEKVAKEYRLAKITMVSKLELTGMYEKLGYRQVKSLPNFLSKNGESSILMEKHL